jgi:flavin-dependent dehydrogenase
MRDFDVVVVGAGPAGAVAARDLSRAGARVALVDGSHPREKPCGGGVTGRALDLAEHGDPAAAPGSGRVVERVIFEAGGRSAPVELSSHKDLRVFSREEFDSRLLAQACDAGAVLVRARARTIARSGRRWTVTAATETLDTSWVLGADGAGGIVRKHVFRAFGRSQISIAAGSYVDGVETAEIAIAFVDAPRGYLWSFPRPGPALSERSESKGPALSERSESKRPALSERSESKGPALSEQSESKGHLAVGACAQADETTTSAMHAIANAWIDRYPPAAGRPRRRYAWPIPSLGVTDLDAEQPSGAGWMLLGDAAGLVDPITREGIFFAVRSGMLAAAALQGSDPSRIYAAAVRDELHGELRRAARLKAGFYRPRFTRLLIDALNHSDAIRTVMVDLVAGRQPYRGLKRRLISTLEIGLMLRVWRSLREIPIARTDRHL